MAGIVALVASTVAASCTARTMAAGVAAAVGRTESVGGEGTNSWVVAGGGCWEVAVHAAGQTVGQIAGRAAAGRCQSCATVLLLDCVVGGPA